MGKKTLCGERCTLRGDELPPQLMELHEAPEMLEVLGDPDVLNMPTLAVVGARKCTPYGNECARGFVQTAVELGYTIVSHGSLGIAAMAHEAALAAGGKTVAVIAGGIDWCWPNDNAPLFQRVVNAGGAVVSEQERGAKPTPWMFAKRNRIIAGLSQAMLVVECKAPSGAFTTCEHAINLNRPLLAVPGSVFSEQSSGTNRLIADRMANAVVSVKDLERWLARETQ